MSGEIDLYGVFVPTFLVCGVVAFAAHGLLNRALARIGAYRLVWHRPLVELSLFVIILAAVAAIFPRWL